MKTTRFAKSAAFVLIGIAQIITGVLLIGPRTAAIGALCFFVIILNIVLINFGYDIATDVKVFSVICSRSLKVVP